MYRAIRGVAFRGALVLGGAVLATFLALSGGAANAYTVTLSGTNQSSMTSEAGIAPSPLLSDSAVVSSLPFLDSTSAISGSESSLATYDFSNSAFLLDFDHARGGDLGHWVDSTGGIYFSVDAAVDYVAAGIYTAVNGDPQQIALGAALVDMTTGDTLFLSQQQSGSVINESFVLGLSEGDVSNTMTGSLTGSLIAGHEYFFQHDVTSANINTMTGGPVTGLGNLSLTFVPEPSTALLLGLGLAALSRRQRSAQI